MVSPALSRLLERTRVRFGVEIEILDAALGNVYPEGGSNLGRMLKASPILRRALLETLAGDRPNRLDDESGHYHVYPLRRLSKKDAAGLLAIRRNASHLASALDTESWSDLARAVETDLASADALGDERQRSRRLNGALRFVEYITHTVDEATLARSLVQAAAIWFDVDARVYRRTLSRDFVLDTWLPGVKPEAESRVLSSRLVDSDPDAGPMAWGAECGEAGTSHEALLLPMGSGPSADRVLAILGRVSPDADMILRFVARVAGTQFSVLADRRAQQARDHFEAVLSETAKAPELVAIRIVHELAQAVTAASGSLALTRDGHTRRIAAVGPAAEGPVAAHGAREYVPDRLVHTIPLGAADQAVLELRAAPGQEFAVDAALMTDACASVLRIWLSGTLALLDASASVLEVKSNGNSAFAARIQEELERARRFGLRLSLILIDVNGPSDAMPQLQDALRRELRGSDVTGAMGGTRVVALLTHTDAPGTDHVVQRLRQRLADAAERLNMSNLKMGQAAFSPDVRTADALLDLALRQAETLIVH